MIKLTLYLLSLVSFLSCYDNKTKSKQLSINKITIEMNDSIHYAVFAGGCFWCTEAIFKDIDGVEDIVPGYIGGHTENPTYKEVCNGTTGHAEAVKITFDLNKVDFADLLEIFFATHDPTTKNRQGNDIGTQYRSGIFYYNDSQKKLSENYIKQLTESQFYKNPIVTEVTPATTFYVAEDYHKNYFENNPAQSYCYYVVAPKVKKAKEKFADKLKKTN